MRKRGGRKVVVRKCARVIAEGRVEVWAAALDLWLFYGREAKTVGDSHPV